MYFVFSPIIYDSQRVSCTAFIGNKSWDGIERERRREMEIKATKIIRLLYVWNWMDFTPKAITSHFFRHVCSASVCFLSKEFVTVPFRSCRSQFLPRKIISTYSKTFMFVHVSAAILFFFLGSNRLFIIFPGFWMNAFVKNCNQSVRLFGAIFFFSILWFAVLKTDSQRQFYVWKQQSFFFFRPNRILCLFQIVLYYLFIFDVVLWRRTREHLLLKFTFDDCCV